MTLVSADALYRQALLDSARQLAVSYRACIAVRPHGWSRTEVNSAIACRMRAWYHLQRQVQVFLPKDLAAPASDAFVEAVTFFLRVWLHHNAPGLRVAAERMQNRLRPDISVFRGDELVAVVECKTNLGRSRAEWESQFLERELQIAKIAPKAAVFLLVLTAQNWPGFGCDPRRGLQFFTLLDEWPSRIPIGAPANKNLLDPVEPMLQAIGSQAE